MEVSREKKKLKLQDFNTKILFTSKKSHKHISNFKQKLIFPLFFKLQSFSLAGVRHHIALFPLVVSMGLGMAWVVFFSTRTLTRNPDVAWRKQESPWNDYRNKQFKFMNPNGVDFTTASKDPEYK